MSNLWPRIEPLLAKVEKPARYIGMERGSLRPNHRPDQVAWLLLYPDAYEVGLPNQGLQILYEILNERDDAVAERAYAPWTDLEGRAPGQRGAAVLRRHSPRRRRRSTSSPSTSRPSSSTRTCSTCIDLAGVPVRADQRTPEHPLVIAGGHCAFNPEPLADFVDAFVIGDGEEPVGEITEVRLRVEARRPTAHAKACCGNWPRFQVCTSPRCTTSNTTGRASWPSPRSTPTCPRSSTSAPSPTSPIGRTRRTSSYRSSRSSTTASTSRSSAAARAAAGSARRG